MIGCQYLLIGFQYLWLAVSTCDGLSVAVSTCDWLSVPVTGCQYLWVPVIGCQYLWQAVSTCDWLAVKFYSHCYFPQINTAPLLSVTGLYVHYMLVLSYNIQLYRNISHKIIQLWIFVAFFFLLLSFISICLCDIVSKHLAINSQFSQNYTAKYFEFSQNEYVSVYWQNALNPRHCMVVTWLTAVDKKLPQSDSSRF